MNREQRCLGLGLLLAAGALSGCSRAAEAPPPSARAATEASPTSAGSPALAASAASTAGDGSAKTPVTNRKIIRQAELELEVPSAGSTQSALEQLAERHGGYVVSAARDTDNGSAIDVRVTVVVRVPQTELTSTIAELKRMGRGIGSERITSDDVTDEYVDLAARTASQRQLELQYLEILKRATTVKDAMEVQKELAEVRTEIERMQGRQQLLEKEAAFSTLTVHLSTAVPRVAVTTTTFGGSVQRAWADAQSLSIDMVTGAIRLIGVLVPVILLLVLPGALALWAMLRLMRWLGARRNRRLLAT
ncbi:MAG: DUF4349 domain-containing protein [Myxococcales bacterium]